MVSNNEKAIFLFDSKIIKIKNPIITSQLVLNNEEYNNSHFSITNILHHFKSDIVNQNAIVPLEQSIYKSISKTSD